MPSILRLPLQSILLFSFCFGLNAMFSVKASAQETSGASRSIEVLGTGKASAKPDWLVVSGFLNSEDKTAKKVLGKFLNVKKKLEETVNPMDFPDVEIEFKDSLFNTNLNSEEMMMGAAEGMTSDGYYLSQPIKIRIKIGENESEKSTLEMLSKLVDSAETIGVAFNERSDPMMGFVETGMNSLASGDLTDRDSLKNQANKQAFADARSQAEKLAELAGGKLGKVISIKASGTAEGDDPTSQYMSMVMGMADAAKADSINLIEVSQSLRVKFELVD